jgi:undecaprenyl-diphosphatase
LVAVVLGVGCGALAALIVWRWPRTSLAAPRVEPATIVQGVRRHEGVARVLRARLDPGAATGLALTAAASLVVGGGVAVGLLLLMVRRSFGFARWDLSAARWGALHARPGSTTFLRDLSQLGGTTGLVIVVIAVAVLAQRRIPNRSALLFLLLVVVGQNLLANGIKLLVDRARPDIDRLTGFAGSSFPSGHATAAAATYAAIALLLSRRRGVATRAALVGGAVAIAVSVAASRVLLGVHWLTDVMAGLALGWAWFALCSIAFGGRLMRFGAPVAVAEEVAEQVAEPTEQSASTRRVWAPGRSAG